VWRVLDTHSIRQFPLQFASRASPCDITFQLESNKIVDKCVELYWYSPQTIPCSVQADEKFFRFFSFSDLLWKYVQYFIKVNVWNKPYQIKSEVENSERSVGFSAIDLTEKIHKRISPEMWPNSSF